MDYKIKLDAFEGPLDLLLHLIQKQELDINDIPISRVTEQYLEYLWAMEQLDLDIASEFLVMGATLLSIKAKLLLPSPPINEEDLDSLVDPRDELVVRLLEYQKYKSLVVELQEKEKEQKKIFAHPFDLSNFIAGLVPPNPLHDVSVWDLLEVYKDVLEESAAPEPVHHLAREEITIGKQMEMIKELLIINSEGLSFRELFPAKPSPTMVVVSFLALLELIRIRKVYFYQNEVFGQIHIVSRQEQTSSGGQMNAVL